MKMLATTYGALGRIDESLALKEQTLEYVCAIKCMLIPANPPNVST